MSVACQVNWASNFVVGIGWPHMQHTMGPYSFVTFGTMLLATFLFTLFYLPETAGRTVTEVQHAANEHRATFCENCCRRGEIIADVSLTDEDENESARLQSQGSASGSAMHYVVEQVDVSTS